jgi:hypothetical protein
MADQILTDAERKALQAILQISDYGEGRAISDSDVYDADFLEAPIVDQYWRQYAPNAQYYLFEVDNEKFKNPQSEIAGWIYNDKLSTNDIITKIQADEELFPKGSDGTQQSWFDEVQSLNREIKDINTQWNAAETSYNNYWEKIGLPKPTDTYDVNALLRIPQYAEYETNVRKFIRSKNDGKYTSYEEDVLKQLREGAQQKLIDSGITPFGDAVLTKKASLLGVTLPKAAPVKSDKPAGTTIIKALGIDEAPRPAVPLATAKAAGAKIKTKPSELINAPTPEQILAKFRQEQGLK